MAQTDCRQETFEFQALGGRRVQANFAGGHLSGDGGGALILREIEKRIGLIARLAGCFDDRRDPGHALAAGKEDILGEDRRDENDRGGQTHLATLYDLSSVLPYPVDIRPMKAKLAMKFGGQYLHYRIGPREWEKAAAEWKLDREFVFVRIVDQAQKLPAAARAVAKKIESPGEVIELLVEGISKSADTAEHAFSRA